VKAHVGAIFDKLHVGTRAEAVALGLRLGLIAL
jgi:DNA-binding CsgD family transcriptional regulator